MWAAFWMWTSCTETAEQSWTPPCLYGAHVEGCMIPDAYPAILPVNGPSWSDLSLFLQSRNGLVQNQISSLYSWHVKIWYLKTFSNWLRNDWSVPCLLIADSRRLGFCMRRFPPFSWPGIAYFDVQQWMCSTSKRNHVNISLLIIQWLVSEMILGSLPE